MKPIRTADDHNAVLDEIASLIDAAPGTAEADRLAVLGVLAADYERRTLGAPADPADVLAVAMQMQGRSQADLAQVLGSRARASEVLSRRRSLSAGMIEQLARAWSLPRNLLGGVHAARSGAPRAVKALSIAAGLVAVTGALTASAFIWAGRDLPDIRPIVAEGRADTGLARLPPHAVQAFLAAEDQRFLAHAGYDPRAIVRAVGRNAVHGPRPAGGATLTQQLAKITLLRGEHASLRRKLREIMLARRLEQALTKDQIAALYLDRVYLGGGAYGVDAAARRYFGHGASTLTVAEAAYLAGLPQAPDAFRFDKPGNWDRALGRRNWVLDRMADQGFLTVAARDLAAREALR